MKNLTIAFLAAASLFTVGACKKKGGGDAGEAMAKMEEFSNDMCKCKDKACADKVQEGMTKWSTDQLIFSTNVHSLTLISENQRWVK